MPTAKTMFMNPAHGKRSVMNKRNQQCRYPAISERAAASPGARRGTGAADGTSPAGPLQPVHASPLPTHSGTKENTIRVNLHPSESRAVHDAGAARCPRWRGSLSATPVKHP